MPKRALLLLTLSLLCSLAAGSSRAQAPAEARSLSVGWFPWDPYTYTEEGSSNYRHLTGLDVELLRAALQQSGHDLQFVQVLWDEQMQAIAQGTQDVAMGALVSDSVDGQAQFSQPYRNERIALFTRAGDRTGLHADSPAELLAALRNSGFRLGASAGYSYGAEVDAYLDDAANAGRIVTAASEYDLFRLLQAGRIDGFVADQLVAATVGWRVGLLSLVRQHPLQLASNEVRMMFGSRVDPQVIAAFDRGMQALHASGDYRRIVRHYVMPLLLAETVERPWFTAINVIASFSLAVSGVILAYAARFSVFGAFVLACLPAVGGGIMRDLVYGGGLHTLKGSLYAEIAIVWGALLSLFFYWQVSRIELNEILLAVLLCCAGACLTRIFVVARGISAPMLVPADAGPAPLPGARQFEPE